MRTETKELILKYCKEDAESLIKLLEQFISSDAIIVKENKIKIDVATITNQLAFATELTSLAAVLENTSGRLLTFYQKNNCVVINSNQFVSDLCWSEEESSVEDEEWSEGNQSLSSDLSCVNESSEVAAGLARILLKEAKNIQSNFLNKKMITILSVGCGDPTYDLNTLSNCCCNFYPNHKFSYIGVDIDAAELSKYGRGKQIGNIEVEILLMDGSDINGLKKRIGRKVDLIIMNHPVVINDSNFIQTFINKGIPELLEDNGSLIVVNYLESETKKLLESNNYNFSSFGNSVTFDNLSTSNAEEGRNEVGLMFTNYKTPTLSVTSEVLPLAMSKTTSPSTPNLRRLSVFSPTVENKSRKEAVFSTTVDSKDSREEKKSTSLVI